jgi:periplasmic protein TonB
MSIKPKPHSQNDFAALEGCFVEGNLEQRARERRIRRRALIISIAAQSAILTAILLVPLFGKPQHLAFANTTPIPPYYHSSAPEHTNAPTQQPPQRKHNIFNNVFSPPHGQNPEPASPEPPGIPPGPGPGAPCAACIPLDDNRHQPAPPADVRQTPHRLLMTHLEPAMLIHRVEPVYPALARQIHREGQVELRATIATDGTIGSLQVVNGDALFLRSAVDAVSQWRYRPTVLNGQPVEIETYITVIYTLQH